MMKDRALKKLKKELDKDIHSLVLFSKEMTIAELLYIIYELHIFRIYNKYLPIDHPGKSKYYKTVTSLAEESFKYLIQILTKHCRKEVVCNKNGVPKLNVKSLPLLIKISNTINSKYELESLIQLYKVRVSGERDRIIEIDTNNERTDINVKKFVEYFRRVELDNEIKKNSKDTPEELFESFKVEYKNYEDMFLKVYGLSIENYIDFIRSIIDKITKRMKEAEEKCHKYPNGNVDENNLKTFWQLGTCFLFKTEEMPLYSDEKYKMLIDKLTFDPIELDERQLRYFLVNRKPLIYIKNFYIISPELLLDHIFTNTHYSLLEFSSVKDEYKERYSKYFLDKISLVCSKYGYREEKRTVELYDGKKQLGDLDLLFINKSGQHLVVEAKNHSLPLNVYFEDLQATKERLADLRIKWEDKVIKRYEYLKRTILSWALMRTLNML